jgi:hypothetical protein
MGRRWLEIHEVEGVGSGALYHVSVLGRVNGDPVWRIRHLVSKVDIASIKGKRADMRLLYNRMHALITAFPRITIGSSDHGAHVR